MTQTAIIILTIAVYLVFMAVMGITSRKSVKTLSDFTVGGGNASAWLSALSYGTAYFSAVMFIGYSGTSGWKYGGWAVLVGIGNAIFGSLLAWLVLAKRTRKIARSFEIKTMPQFFNARYNSNAMKLFSSIVIFIFLIPYSASVYKGLTSVCSVLLGVNETITMIIIALASMAILLLGGYLAAIKADFVQGIIMFFGIILLIIFVMRAPTITENGGLNGLVKLTDELNLGGKDWVALISTILMTSFGTWGLPQMIHKYYGIKDDKEVKRGTIISTIFALLVAGGGYFIGSFGRMFYSSLDEVTNKSTDFIVPNILKNANMPSILLGIVLVLLISASVSTLSSITMTASTTAVMDIFKTCDCCEKRTTKNIRSLCVLFVIFSYLVANTNTPILDMMSYSWGILSGSFLAPYMLCLYLKFINKKGAFASMIVGFIVAFIPAGSMLINQVLPNVEIFATLKTYGPQFAVGAMILSFIVCILVSKLTKKEDYTKFYKKAEI